jgi:hypothetical protein
MRAVIEIKELSIDSPDKLYINSTYQGDGFYLVTDNQQIKSFICVVGYCVYLVNSNGLPSFIKIEEEIKQTGGVSEEFVLKLLSLSLNKERFKDLTQPKTL